MAPKRCGRKSKTEAHNPCAENRPPASHLWNQTSDVNEPYNKEVMKYYTAIMEHPLFADIKTAPPLGLKTADDAANAEESALASSYTVSPVICAFVCVVKTLDSSTS